MSLGGIKSFFINLWKKIKPSKEVSEPPIQEPKPIETVPSESEPVESKKYVTGVDIYWGDKVSDWSALKKEIDFMFIKATEGDWRDDPKFKEYRRKAAEHGIPCGFYHFYRSNKSPKAQAEDFIRVVGEILPGELPPVCDWETEDDPNDGPDIGEVQEFLDIIEKHFKVTPIIYSGSAFAAAKKLPTTFTRYPLWLAHYTKSSPKVPAPWKAWTFWQNTDTAKVKGITNPCDFNFFNGSLDDLKKLIKG